MKISLLNLNLIAKDAIGMCIINQVRSLRNHGDDVQVYVLHPPDDAPGDVQSVVHVVTLADLIEGTEEHFRLSDLYIYHYPGRYDLMESIRGIERGTVIFHYHNVTPPELWGSEEGREQLMRGLEGRALAHYADLCLADSPFNKQDLVEEVGISSDRVIVLPMAVDLQALTPGARNQELVERYGLEGQRVLLFVGRMAGNKRIDLLVKALARIQQEVPNVKLLLVGDDRSSPVYEQTVAAARRIAADLGIAGDVIWTGRVENLADYYRLADVYVTASLHEGFGVPLIEAMACGVPVVASRVGAMPWVLGDAGLLCEPGDADDLAAKTLSLLQDGDLAHALAERGLERAKAFTLEQYEKRFTEIVEQAAARTLPAVPRLPEGREGKVDADLPPVAPGRQVSLLQLQAENIQKRSDTALRGYVVRSKAPLIGPLIAWVRRNLTSHLREPYLDPIIERQVNFNRQSAEWMTRAATLLADQTQRLAELEARLQALEAQLSQDEKPEEKQP